MVAPGDKFLIRAHEKQTTTGERNALRNRIVIFSRSLSPVMPHVVIVADSATQQNKYTRGNRVPFCSRITTRLQMFPREITIHQRTTSDLALYVSIQQLALLYHG